MSLSLIKPSGDYHKLLAYQKANLVYDYYIVVCDGKNIKVKVK